MGEIWESKAHLHRTKKQKEIYNKNYDRIFGKKSRKKGIKVIYKNGKWTEVKL